MPVSLKSFAAMPLIILSSPALAADGTAPAPSEQTDSGTGGQDADQPENEIVVLATRLRGEVIAPQPPLVTLDEKEIEAYGASSLTDLVGQISPQTGSGRGRGSGRPVFLVNGQRISDFRELRDIPPEAIRKLEVLPEETALRYGYPPDQRVINFILKDAFASRSAEGEFRVPTLGGFTETEATATLVRIAGPQRLNVTAKASGTSLLSQRERGLIQSAANIPDVAGDPDPARFRSLIDDSRQYSLNATLARGLGEGGADGSFALNAAYTHSDSRSLLGLDTVLLVAPGGARARRSLAGALTGVSHADTFELGASLNKPLGRWQLAATVNASHSDTRSRIGREADTAPLVAAAAAGSLDIGGPLPVLANPGFDRSRTRDDSLVSLATLVGSPFSLPAGDASLTVKGGFAYTQTNNRDAYSGTTKLRRGDLSAGANLALPLASRKRHVLDGVGDLTLNFSAGVNRLSDFGTLFDWSAGATWSPAPRLSLQASYIVNEAAPSLNQLANPEQRTFGVPVFDYTRGETALVTIINGGNRDLVKERQRDLKLSANWQLPFIDNGNLVVEYFRNHSTNVTQDFPLLTPAIESAFPGRALRDASGRLLAIDRRPVTFADVSGSRIRWGLNVSGRLGPEAPGRRGGGARGGGGYGESMGFMPGRGRGGGAGRWNLSLYHTWRITEAARIAPGLPQLDLLGGDALRVGGVPRHSLELEGGVFKQGLGLRLNGTWNAPVRLAASVPGGSALRFGSTFIVNARAFVNFDQKPKLVEAVPFLEHSRLSLKVDNLFNSRQKVTDQTGLVPLAYQADFRDPRGRVIGIELRKQF